jgi:hypothetical protein
MPDTIRKLFLQYLPKILFMKNFIIQNNDPLDFEIAKDLHLLRQSATHKKSLESIFTSNAIITREIRGSCTSLPLSPAKQNKCQQPDYDNSNFLLLVESDGLSVASSRTSKKKQTTRLKGERKSQGQVSMIKENRDSLHLQSLICENIHYLDEIDNLIKRDFLVKKANI